MKNFKKIISIILTSVIIFGTCVGFSGCTGNPDDSAITRGEWIAQLSQKMGLDEYQSETNYFKDIKEDNEIYSYVQACVEWDILDEEDSPYFYEDFKATKGFISETIVRASTILNNAEATEDEIFQCAINNDIVTSKSDANDSVQRKDVDSYLDKAFDLYSNKEFVEYNNVIINKDVIDVTGYRVLDLGDGQYEISTSELKVDDIIILPATSENPSGVARKITSVSTSNGKSVVETVEPELEEVYDQVEFAQSVTPSAENAILEDGVTLDESGNINLEDVLKKAEQEELEYQKSKPSIEPLGTFKGNEPDIEETKTIKNLKFNYNFTKGKPSVSAGFDIGETALSASVSDESLFNKSALEECGKFFKDKTTFSFKDLPNYGTTKDGWEKTLTGGGKMTGGYEISGSVGFDSLTVDTELKLKKALGVPYGIKYFKVKLGSEASVQTSFKGTIDHEIKIATTPIPTPIAGVTINVNFYILVSAEGVMTLKIGVGQDVIVEYQDGNWRKTKETSAEASAEVAITIKFGPGIGVSIAALGINIIDVRLDAKGVIDASASVKFDVNEINDETGTKKNKKLTVTVKADFYAPTLTVKIGTKGTLAKKIGLSVSWDLVKKENAVFHKELYKNEWVLYEEEEIIEEEISTEVETTEPTELFSDEELDGNKLVGFQISTYSIGISVGQSQKIEATVPDDFSVEDVSWSSSNTSVATVDNSGNVVAVGEGVATVTASLDGEELQCAVFVNEE